MPKIKVKGDTVAAGDGFVSGFFFKFIELEILNKLQFNQNGIINPFINCLDDLKLCVEYGNSIAGEIIQNEGASI